MRRGPPLAPIGRPRALHVLEEVKKAGFKTPTPIQSQGWPMALSGRDVIGIVQTGVGAGCSRISGLDYSAQRMF